MRGSGRHQWRKPPLISCTLDLFTNLTCSLGLGPVTPACHQHEHAAADKMLKAVVKMCKGLMLWLQVTHQQAAHEARELRLEACGHSHDTPFPPLPTAEQLQAAAAQQKLVQQAVSRPNLRPRSHQRDSLWSVAEDQVQARPVIPSDHKMPGTAGIRNVTPAQVPAAMAAAATCIAPGAPGHTPVHGNSHAAPATGSPCDAATADASAVHAAALTLSLSSRSGNQSAAAAKSQPAKSDGWTVVARKPSRHNKWQPYASQAAPGSVAATFSTGTACKSEAAPAVAAGNGHKGPHPLAAAQPAPRPIIPGAEEEARTPATPAARRNAAR